MASNAPLQPCLLSSFLGERVAYSAASSLQLLRPRAPPSTKDAHLRVSRTFSSLTDFLFSRRNQPNIEKSKHKCLQPGNVSPRLHVPSHIPRPPYVNSRLSPGIASGPEVHDERGIECMRASGKLAAQVLLRAGSLVKGYHGDTSATFFCGDVDDEAKSLVQVTQECLNKGISICAPGVEFNRIGKVIHDHADKFKYGVVRQFVGHGVGRVFHADPVILHYRNTERGRMRLGQTFTIEPMLTMGSTNPIIWRDNWTAVTQDGSLSAQFEHTILITENGAEILTQC